MTQVYTRHLLAVAQSGTLTETVAAILLCYWIYWEVGKRLSPTLPADPLYAEWIQAYNGEDFEMHVQQQLSLVDRLLRAASVCERRRGEKHFMQSSCYEYLFWEQAYQREEWSM